MKLIPNWKKVLTKAWSVRLLAIAFLLGTVDMTLAQFPEAVLELGRIEAEKAPWFLPAMQTFSSLGALIARVWAQKEFEGDRDV